MMMPKDAPNQQGGSVGSSSPLLGGADLPWLMIALITAVALRLGWVLYVNVDPTDGRLDDSAFYDSAARFLARGAGYVNPWNGLQDASWPPAYPASLAVLYKLFGEHVLLAKLLNLGFAAVTIVLAYVIARHVFDRRTAFLGSMALAFFPGHIYFSTLVMTESMFGMVFLLVLLLALLWTIDSNARPWQLLTLGILVGLAALVRAEGLFLAGVLAVFWALTVRPWHRLLPHTGLLAIGIVLALTPWTVRNAIQLGEFVPIRTNTDTALSGVLDPDAGPGTIFTEPQPASESLRHYAAKPWDFPRLAGQKLRRLYQDDADSIRWIQALHVPLPASYTFESPLNDREATRWTRLANGYFFTVGALALAAAAYCLLARLRASLVVLVAVAGWSFVFSIVNPEPRYHFPLEPLMSILAAALAVAVWDAVSGARRSADVNLPTTAAEASPAGDRGS